MGYRYKNELFRGQYIINLYDLDGNLAGTFDTASEACHFLGTKPKYPDNTFRHHFMRKKGRVKDAEGKWYSVRFDKISSVKRTGNQELQKARDAKKWRDWRKKQKEMAKGWKESIETIKKEEQPLNVDEMLKSFEPLTEEEQRLLLSLMIELLDRTADNHLEEGETAYKAMAENAPLWLTLYGSCFMSTGKEITYDLLISAFMGKNAFRKRYKEQLLKTAQEWESERKGEK